MIELLVLVVVVMGPPGVGCAIPPSTTTLSTTTPVSTTRNETYMRSSRLIIITTPTTTTPTTTTTTTIPTTTPTTTTPTTTSPTTTSPTTIPTTTPTTTTPTTTSPTTMPTTSPTTTPTTTSPATKPVPLVTSLIPDYGPVAGGTLVNITGSQLRTNSSWPVDVIVTPSAAANQGVRGAIVNSSETWLQVEMPSVNESLADHTFQVHVVFNRGRRLLAGRFSYKGNPEVGDFYPSTTIERGGTTVTVEGRSLTSVARPLLEITMTIFRLLRDDVTRDIFFGVCEAANDTLLLCGTPALDIPEVVKDAARDNHDNATGQVDYNSNSYEVLFYIGFKFGPYDLYRNLSNHPTLGDKSQLSVNIAPQPIPLAEQFVVRPGTPLIIRGENMAGVKASDYSVLIGVGQCHIEDVTVTSLVCQPPQDPPRRVNESSSGVYDIQMEVGQLTYSVGTASYPPRDLWALWGSLLGLVAIVVIAITIFMVIRYKKRAQRSQSEQVVVLPPRPDQRYVNDVTGGGWESGQGGRFSLAETATDRGATEAPSVFGSEVGSSKAGVTTVYWEGV